MSNHKKIGGPKSNQQKQSFDLHLDDFMDILHVFILCITKMKDCAVGLLRYSVINSLQYDSYQKIQNLKQSGESRLDWVMLCLSWKM